MNVDKYVEKINSFKICHINFNGWTSNNEKLRQELIKGSECELIGVMETHLKENESIKVEGYCWYGKNRMTNVNKGSGGMGILVKDDILGSYTVGELSLDSEHLHGIKLQNDHTNFKIGIYVIYLPPEGSSYSKNIQGMYDELLMQVYTTVNWDNILIMGDFNSRVGNLKVTCETDQMSDCRVVDETVNGHGKMLLNFLIESKCCILNGRVTGDNDYTLENVNGRSVVDYFIARHVDVENYAEVGIRHCIELVSNGANISEKSRLSDHKAITIRMKASYFSTNDLCRNLGSQNYKKSKVRRKIPKGYMQWNRVGSVIEQMLADLDSLGKDQGKVDTAYTKLLELIDREAGLNDDTTSNKRRNTPYKPYWDKELSSL